jgi:hypothetical protein
VIHTSTDDRPELPRRRRQANLAPELLAQQPRLQEPSTGHDPDLMAAFRRGFDKASENNDATADHQGESSHLEN